MTFQIALAFLVIHSLRWNDSSFDARAYRIFLSVGWIGHAFFLVHSEAARALPSVYGVGAFTMVVCVLTRLFTGSWKSIVVPIAAALVLLAQPGDWLMKKMLVAPVGLLVVTGSFVVFALGTWAALTKSRWNHPPPATFPTDNKSELMLL